MMSNMSMTMADPLASLNGQAVVRLPTPEKQRYAFGLRPLDVLCGNEKCFERHTGNMKYQLLLNKMRSAFHSTESKTAKKKLVRELDDFIQGYGGRFLRMDESTSRLRVMTTAESRNKISRSLCENPSSQKTSKVFTARITELDVMCGRGGKANHHLGNKIYRKLVSDMKEQYKNTEDKDDKTELSRCIVDQVCDYGGRFVKKDSGSGRYYVLTKTEARIKTSQALRENRDSKTAQTDDSESDSEGSYKTLPLRAVSVSVSVAVAAVKPVAAPVGDGLDTDSLDCCKALVSLSKAASTPVSLLCKAA